MIDQPSQELQRDFLKEIFFIPETPNEVPKKEDGTKEPIIPDIEPKLSKFKISRLEKGFKISLNRTDIVLPIQAKIKVAYDVIRGNPFKQHEIHDFDFGGNLISINFQGCAILAKDKNIIDIEVMNNSFYLTASGFDYRRDLVINVRERNNEA